LSHDRGPLTPAAIRLNCSCMTEVTRILNAIEQGDPHASDELLPLVYDELRKLAAQKLAHEKPGHTPRRPKARVHALERQNRKCVSHIRRAG